MLKGNSLKFCNHIYYGIFPLPFKSMFLGHQKSFKSEQLVPDFWILPAYLRIEYFSLNMMGETMVKWLEQNENCKFYCNKIKS